MEVLEFSEPEPENKKAKSSDNDPDVESSKSSLYSSAAPFSEYESQDYLPPHSDVYLDWLKRQPRRSNWDKWVMMGVIGLLTGLTGFFLHQLIDTIVDTKWSIASQYISQDRANYGEGWIFTLLYSALMILVSSIIVVFFRPSAAGSGVPELIGFLNGSYVRKIFNLKTYVAKFVSCVLSVGSGMPVGPEGPMIHLGSIIGAGMSQFQSRTLGIKFSFFERFRNPEDRRNFISAGAAAGISSAFGAPVGGLLFAMEEMSSFWTSELSWQVLFCSMVAAFTTDLFNSSFHKFEYTGSFGLFKTTQYIMFQIDSGIDLNIIGIVPAMILGVLGGLLGSLFIKLHLKIAHLRKMFFSRFPEGLTVKTLKVLEPLSIIFIYTTVSVLLPALFPCTQMTCFLQLDDQLQEMVCQDKPVDSGNGNTTNFVSLVRAKPSVQTYTCPNEEEIFTNGTGYFNGSYNEAATLFFVNGEEAIRHLFSRNTHLEFGYGPLIIFFIFYFLFSCWSSGTNISCGLVVPMLLIGGLYGRILGRVFVDMFGVHSGPYWDWMDPGAFALLGAVSFFGGVSRLTMSLAVIMVEITNDIQFLLLIIITIMFAKWTGDYFGHSLYHSLLEYKEIPFLPEDVKINRINHNLEHFSVDKIMSTPVQTIQQVESLTRIVDLLKNSRYGGFPVVDNEDHFIGLITRFELMMILNKATTGRLLSDENTTDKVVEPNVEYHDISKMRSHYMADPSLNTGMLSQAMMSAEKNNRINLSRYVNRSPMSIPESFSVQRSFTIFRVLGLRHLTVVDTFNRVKGLVTRKDLMETALEHKLLDQKV